MHKIVCDFKGMATGVREILSSGDPQIELDFSGWRYVHSYYLTMARCLIDFAIGSGRQIFITPPTSASCRDYAGRMGLFRGTTYNYPYKPHQPHTFFPLTKIVNDRTEFLYEEMNRVLLQSNIPANYITSLCDSFTELANNVFYHSGHTENSGWGYVHAQAYPTAKKIKLAIADNGVGFWGSYGRTNQIRGRTPDQVVCEAFNELESSLNKAPGQGYRGIGLSEVRTFIKNNQAKLYLWTGATCACVTSSNISANSLEFDCAGTTIEFEVPIV